MPPTDATARITNVKHDPRDPNPWLALYVDASVPLHQTAKANFLMDVGSRSRQFFFPLIRPFCRLAICFNKVCKTIIPNAFTSSWLLHRSIYLGLKWFVSPQANYLIMRHFHIGTELLQFVAANTKGVRMQFVGLRPEALKDLVHDVFLQHDLNIYNFIIEYNRQLNEQGLELEPVEQLDFSCLTDGDFPIKEMSHGWFNIIDLEDEDQIQIKKGSKLLKEKLTGNI